MFEEIVIFYRKFGHFNHFFVKKCRICLTFRQIVGYTFFVRGGYDD